MNVINVKDLKRTYKLKKGKDSFVVEALKGISFNIEEGEIFGLLGPNGAGKSTTIKILTTLLTPTSGEVSILDKSLSKSGAKIRKDINFVFGGEKGVYGRLTASEYLNYFATLYKISKREKKQKVDELLNLVGLDNNKSQKIATFSKGMKQRLHIARSLINEPKILFLDEPTIGLDPSVSNKIRGIIRNLKTKNITVILTTHYMKEAEDLCDRIAFISNGQIILSGSPSEIKGRYAHLDIYESTCKFRENTKITERLLKNLQVVTVEKNLKILRFEVDKEVTFEMVKVELERNVEVLELEQKQITLDDVFINLIGSV